MSPHPTTIRAVADKTGSRLSATCFHKNMMLMENMYEHVIMKETFREQSVCCGIASNHVIVHSEICETEFLIDDNCLVLLIIQMCLTMLTYIHVHV